MTTLWPCSAPVGNPTFPELDFYHSPCRSVQLFSAVAYITFVQELSTTHISENGGKDQTHHCQPKSQKWSGSPNHRKESIGNISVQELLTNPKRQSQKKWRGRN